MITESELIEMEQRAEEYRDRVSNPLPPRGSLAYLAERIAADLEKLIADYRRVHVPEEEDD